jgi:hypothetical protein
MGGEALALIAALTLLAASGWWAFSRSRKRVGEIEEENRELRKGIQARSAQEAAFDSSRGYDLADDAKRLSDAGRGSAE